MRALENLYFELSGGCNLLCAHCYVFDDGSKRARPDRLTPELVGATVRAAVQLGLTDCTFTGGEVLLRRDLVEILQAVAPSIERIHLLSNLTLLRAEHVEALRHLPIAQVATSLDGLEQSHDRFRGEAGAFRATWSAMMVLRAAGIPLKVSVTVTPENIDEAPTLFHQLDEMGIPASVARVAAVGRGSLLSIVPRDFNRRYAELLADRMARAISPRQLRSLSTVSGVRSTYCGVGESILYVMSDGSVGLCPTMTPATDSRWGIGHLGVESIEEIWRRHVSGSPDPLVCATSGTCGFGEICKGGCRSNAYTVTGDPGACDQEMWDGFTALARRVPQTPHYAIT